MLSLAVLSCGAVYHAVQGGTRFWVCRWNPNVWPFKWKLLSITLQWCKYYAVQDSSHFWVCGWNLKGPLKYLLRPLLGKNQFAVTQRTYACIGPNLDNIYWGQVWFSSWRHRTTPNVTWSETEKCILTERLTSLPIISCTIPFRKLFWRNLSMDFGLRRKIKKWGWKMWFLDHPFGYNFFVF